MANWIEKYMSLQVFGTDPDIDHFTPAPKSSSSVLSTIESLVPV